MKREMINTHSRSVQKLSGRAQSGILPFAILVMWAANGPDSLLAQESAQPTFPSAAEASQSLFQAVQSNDVQGIEKILGGATELASSHDDDQDKADREVFVKKYQEMHRLCREADGSMTLTIGAENWPFPVPLVEKNGAWRFDPMAGAKEVTFRRIGNNELTAIATPRIRRRWKAVSCKSNAAGFDGQLYHQSDSESCRRIRCRRSCTVGWLLFPLIGHKLGGQIRLDRLPGGLSVIWCDDLHSHVEGCCL